MMKRTTIKILALALAVLGGVAMIWRGRTVASAETAGSVASYSSTAAATTASVDETEDLFTQRDLEQEPDLSGAVYLSVTDGDEICIEEAGVYVLSGTAENATVTVDAEGEKVQLVLDGLEIENEGAPCSYLKSADKVFVTTVADSSLSMSGEPATDEEKSLDGAIFSRDDLTLNGTATLTISSSAAGIVSKDDLKVTGGTYVISAATKCLEANDSIRIADGTFSLTAGTDGIHAENDEDDSLGYVTICGGSFQIRAGDDGIHALAYVQIAGGSFQIAAAEGIEGTYVLITEGSIAIESWDDGINASRKSGTYKVCVEIAGGEIQIAMSAGDTDGIDSNGDVIVSGGTITITGNSSFDYDGTAQFTGGTLIVNGQTLSSIPNQMMGGMGGQMGGFGGQGGMGGQGGDFGGQGGDFGGQGGGFGGQGGGFGGRR